MCGECNWPIENVKDYAKKNTEQKSVFVIPEAETGDKMRPEIACPMCGKNFTKKSHNHVRCLDCTTIMNKFAKKKAKATENEKRELAHQQTRN